MDPNCFVQDKNVIFNVIDSVLKTIRKLEEEKNGGCHLVKKILIENNHEENHRVHLIGIGRISIKVKEEVSCEQSNRFEAKVSSTNAYSIIRM